MVKLTNISFQFTDSDLIDFSFECDSVKRCAQLTLPGSLSCHHLVGGRELDCSDKQSVNIFNQLESFFFAQFKNPECAKASAQLKTTVYHVGKVDDVYVAFTATDERIISSENVLSEIEQWELINAAVSEFYAASARRLKNVLIVDVMASVNKDKNSFKSTFISEWFDRFEEKIKHFIDREFKRDELSKRFYTLHAQQCKQAATEKIESHLSKMKLTDFIKK